MECFAHVIFRNGNIDETAVSISYGRRQQGIELIVCMLVWCHFNSSSYRSASRIASSVAMDGDCCNLIPCKLILQCRDYHDTRHLAHHLQVDTVVVLCTGYRSRIGHIVSSGNLVGFCLISGHDKGIFVHAVCHRIVGGEGHLV